MVIYITSSDPRFIIYLGKDKYENEELIKWGFPNDIWFHVDKFSSAHVYLRLPPEITIKTIPKEIMNECLQLVRDGSIEGRKQEKVSICYTPWEIGEVGFKDEKEVYHIKNVTKDKELLKRLLKTKIEKEVDLEQERKAFDLEEKNKKKKAMEEKKKKEKEDAIKHKEELKEKRFEYIDEIGEAHTNKEDIDYDEDFM